MQYFIFFLESSLRIIISAREFKFKTKEQMLTALLARDPPDKVSATNFLRV